MCDREKEREGESVANVEHPVLPHHCLIRFRGRSEWVSFKVGNRAAVALWPFFEPLREVKAHGARNGFPAFVRPPEAYRAAGRRSGPRDAWLIVLKKSEQR